MNQLKIYTIDDINKLKGWERTEALMKWQQHNNKRWKQVKKEIHSFSDKISRTKRIYDGKCVYCGKTRERKNITICNSCSEKKKIWKKKMKLKG